MDRNCLGGSDDPRQERDYIALNSERKSLGNGPIHLYVLADNHSRDQQRQKRGLKRVRNKRPVRSKNMELEFLRTSAPDPVAKGDLAAAIFDLRREIATRISRVRC